MENGSITTPPRPSRDLCDCCALTSAKCDCSLSIESVFEADSMSDPSRRSAIGLHARAKSDAYELVSRSGLSAFYLSASCSILCLHFLLLHSQDWDPSVSASRCPRHIFLALIMVYCGLPSKACGNCRAKKLRVCLDHLNRQPFRELKATNSVIKHSQHVHNADEARGNAPATATSWTCAFEIRHKQSSLESKASSLPQSQPSRHRNSPTTSHQML